MGFSPSMDISAPTSLNDAALFANLQQNLHTFFAKPLPLARMASSTSLFTTPSSPSTSAGGLLSDPLFQGPFEALPSASSWDWDVLDVDSAFAAAPYETADDAAAAAATLPEALVRMDATVDFGLNLAPADIPRDFWSTIPTHPAPALAPTSASPSPAPAVAPVPRKLSTGFPDIEMADFFDATALVASCAAATTAFARAHAPAPAALVATLGAPLDCSPAQFRQALKQQPRLTTGEVAVLRRERRRLLNRLYQQSSRARRAGVPAMLLP